jgi:hypothetical protein
MKIKKSPFSRLVLIESNSEIKVEIMGAIIKVR